MIGLLLVGVQHLQATIDLNRIVISADGKSVATRVTLGRQ